MPLDLVFATQLDEHDHGWGSFEDIPAMILIYLINGRQRYMMFVVVDVNGPGSSQNILSTP